VNQLGGEWVLDGNVVVNLDRCQIVAGKKEVNLTVTECALLACLLENAGAVLTRDELILRLWGDGFRGKPATVNTHVQRLRKKLGKAARALHTVRGQGYRWKSSLRSLNH